MKQRTEALNKQIVELRSDLENALDSVNEKNSVNMKLFNENNNLTRTLESRNSEITGLREQLSYAENEIAKLNSDKISLEKQIRNLNEVKENQKSSLDKSSMEIDRLNNICSEQDDYIRRLSDEKMKVLAKNDELNFEVKNLNGKLKTKEDNINFLQHNLEESNKKGMSLEVINLFKFQNHITALEQQLNRVKSDLNNETLKLNSEKSARAEAERNGQRLDQLLNERAADIRRLTQELETARINIEKLNSEKARLFGESDKFKNHIVLLTEQNQKVKGLFNC
jgi:chromosome segregation ATPase